MVSPEPPTRRLPWGRVLLVLGAGGALVGSLMLAYRWGLDRLEALQVDAERELERVLLHPVRLGRLETVTPWMLRLGRTEVLPTAKDGDRLSLSALEIHPDWEQLLRGRVAARLRLIRPDLTLVQEPDRLWLRLGPLPEGDLPSLQLEVVEGRAAFRLRDAQLKLLPPVAVQSVNANVQLQPSGQAWFRGGLDLLGSTVQASGRFRPQARDLEIAARGQRLNLPGLQPLLTALIPLPLRLTQGQSDFHLSSRWRVGPVFDLDRLQGSVRLRQLTLRNPSLPLPLELQGGLRFRGDRLEPHQLTGRFGSATLAVRGQLGRHSAETLQLQAQNLALGGDRLRLQATVQGPWPRARFGLQATGDSLQMLQARARLEPRQLVLDQLQGRWRNGLQAVARGTLDWREPLDTRLRLQAQAQAPRLPPLMLGLQGSWQQGWLRAEGQGRWGDRRLDLALRQRPDGLELTRLRLQDGQGGGLLATGQLQGQRWQGQVRLDNLATSPWVAGVETRLGGRIDLAGRTDQSLVTGLQARGEVQTLGPLDYRRQRLSPQPLQLRFGWQAGQLDIADLRGDRLRLQGSVTVTPDLRVRDWDLQARLDRLPLQQLPLPLPTGDRRGWVSFAGRLRGTPAQPRIAGDLRLQELQLGGVRLGDLAGQLNNRGQTLAVSLGGRIGRLALQANPSQGLTDLVWRRGDGELQVQRQGPDFRWRVRDLPLAGLALPLVAQRLPLDGRLGGEGWFRSDLSRGLGRLAVEEPGLGYYRARRLVGSLALSPGQITLSDLQLFTRQGRADLGLTYRFQGTPSLGLTAQLQDFALADLALIGLSGQRAGLLGPQPDFARATTVVLPPLDVTRDSVWRQLQRLAQVDALEQERRQQQSLLEQLPPVQDIQGRLTASLTLEASPRQVRGAFNLQGDRWAWGPLQAEQVRITGTLDPRGALFEQLSLRSGPAQFSFTGRIGPEAQNGQLQLADIPLAGIKDWLPQLPYDLAGTIDLTASLAGTRRDPQLVGAVDFSDTTVDGTPLRSQASGFNYRAGRLSFGLDLTTDKPGVLRITGGLPLQPPDPTGASQELALNITARDDGLSFLNLFSQGQVDWDGGQGDVQLRVRGSLDKPLASGIAQFKGGQLTSPLLPEPVKDLTGTVHFEQRRLRVEELTAGFSGGRMLANGILPIQRGLGAELTPEERPLTLQLQDLDLQLPKLLQGRTNGTIQVGGALFSPSLSGDVALRQAQIQLPDTPSVGVGLGELTNPDQLPVQFDGLALRLGENVQVERSPVFRAAVSGDVKLYGLLGPNLQPVGEVVVDRGQVNLFTATFIFDPNHRNVVRFKAPQGLDPTLDVQLQTSVPEGSPALFTSNRLTGELPNSLVLSDIGSYGSFQLVRVTASVDALASNLMQSIQLSSSPPRSQDQLLSLLGTGQANTLINTGQSGAAIATVLGSALLNSIQEQRNSNLGERIDVQLFPYVLEAAEQRTQFSQGALSTTVGLGGQLGFNITDQLQVSVLQVLTLSVPTQYNLRYQLNGFLGVRATTDNAGNSRGVLELNTRF